MGLILLVLLVAVPFLEIAAFIEIGGRIGLTATLALVVATAVAGMALLRHQGLAVLERAQRTLARHELPIPEIVDGVCLLVAGVLLLTPGFLTDAVGFALMIPPLRRALTRPLWRYLAARGGVWVWSSGPADDDIIDGAYEDVTPEDDIPADRLPPRNAGDGPEREP